MEPEWDEEQAALMVALTVWEANRCPGCGEQLSESTATHNDRDNRDGTGWYEVGPPIRCHACTAMHGARERFQSEAGTRAHSVIFQPIHRSRNPR